MLRSGRSAVALVSALLLFDLSAAGKPEKPSGSRGVKAIMELSQQFYYAGDPLQIRISIGNNGEVPVANPLKTPLFEAFDVQKAEGVALKASGKQETPEPTRPDKLSPNAFYGAIVDLTQIFPDLKTPGTYQIRWAADGVASDTIMIRIIPRYNPERDYRARFETDQGVFVIDFFKKTAPIAVKAFVDMANSGFYDGLAFQTIRPDLYVVGGDPRGNGAGQTLFTFPAELSNVPVVTGTVLMKPVGAAPPANGSQFIIMLHPDPTYTGQLTVLGQVVEGLDVVHKIALLPSTQQASQPHFRPLKEIVMRKVTVLEKGTAGGP